VEKGIKPGKIYKLMLHLIKAAEGGRIFHTAELHWEEGGHKDEVGNDNHASSGGIFDRQGGERSVMLEKGKPTFGRYRRVTDGGVCRCVLFPGF